MFRSLPDKEKGRSSRNVEGGDEKWFQGIEQREYFAVLPNRIFFQ